MRGPARLLVVVLLPVIVGKLVEMYLRSRSGQAAMARVGSAELSTPAGIALARDYVGTGSAALGAAIGALSTSPPARAVGTSAATIALDTAELLIAAGGLVKVVGDFLRDRDRLRA
jgi:hypothetical protein